MSKLAIAAIITLTGAFFFGLGYQIGYEPPAPREYVPLPQKQSGAALTGVSAQVSEILQIADPLERTERLVGFLKGLGAESIPAVRDGYDSVFLDLGDVELRILAQWWARLDPVSAFRWTQIEWSGSGMFPHVIRAWAERDPQAAKEAVIALRINPFVFREVSHALAQGWDQSGQPGLGEFMAGMRSGVDRQRVLGLITRRMVLRDGVEKTTKWVENLPEDVLPDRFKLQAYRRVASAIATLDPLQAAAWAEQRGEGPYGSGLYRRVATRWTDRDGRAAMTWLGTLPRGPELAAAVREGYRRWAASDRPAAVAWMEEQPEAEWLEPARALYAAGVARDEPARGISIVEKFQTPSLRDETLEQIAKAWMHRDGEAAKRWIESSDLSEMAKARALTPKPVRERRVQVEDDDLD